MIGVCPTAQMCLIAFASDDGPGNWYRGRAKFRHDDDIYPGVS
jgi:hypothetical protein